MLAWVGVLKKRGVRDQEQKTKTKKNLHGLVQNRLGGANEIFINCDDKSSKVTSIIFINNPNGTFTKLLLYSTVGVLPLHPQLTQQT